MPIKMDDLGGNTPIFGNIHIYILAWSACWRLVWQVCGVEISTAYACLW